MTSFPDHSHRPPRPAARSTVPAIWDAQQLAQFLQAARVLRLYPALHLVAHTGMRRGEVASLNWGDLHIPASSVSIARTRQSTMGRTVESPAKTRTSRRRIDLDANTIAVLEQWQHRLVGEGATIDPSTPMFLNTHHCTPSPESFSQLFTRTTASCGLPRIRFHDLPHPRLHPAEGKRPREGCQRTPRPQQPGFHDDRLPTRPPRHAGRRCSRVRRRRVWGLSQRRTLTSRTRPIYDRSA